MIQKTAHSFLKESDETMVTGKPGDYGQPWGQDSPS